MDYFDKELICKINKLGDDIFNDECDIVPLDIFGKLVKKILMRENIYFNINNKRVSPNTYIRLYYKNLSDFIIKKTRYNIEIKNNISYIVFS
jgi:hypothetical protein